MTISKLSEDWDQPVAPTSERRFLRLKEPSEAVRTISKEIADFPVRHGMSMKVATRADAVPPQAADAKFKYQELQGAKDALGVGKDLVLSIVQKDDQAIAYGIAGPETSGKREVEIIDVAVGYRRTAGIKTEVNIEGQVFELGLGHVVVHSLMDALSCVLETDATTPSSRYIFTSLGFISISDDNPCLLRWES